MFGAALIGWLCGKAIVGLVRGALRLVEGTAFLVGAAGGLVLAAAGRGREAR